MAEPAKPLVPGGDVIREAAAARPDASGSGAAPCAVTGCRGAALIIADEEEDEDEEGEVAAS